MATAVGPDASDPLERQCRSIFARIHAAPDVDTLAQCRCDVQSAVRDSIVRGVAPEPLTRLLSTTTDLLTRRALELAQIDAGQACPEFCWIAMGSQGRCEQTLNSDQDNAIIFADHGDATATRERLQPLAAQVNAALDSCGLELCRGGIMARERDCCLSLQEWTERFAGWIDHGDPQALLNAAIYFDFRPIHGATALADRLRDWLAAYARDNSRFLLQMTCNALENRPPLGLLRDFALTHGGDHPHTLDLKVNGVTPFVDAARIFGLAAGLTATGTVERLRRAAGPLRLSQAEVDAWSTAFSFIQGLRLRRQDRDCAAGLAAGNHLDPDELSATDRRSLKEAMQRARSLQARLARDFAADPSAFGV